MDAVPVSQASQPSTPPEPDPTEIDERAAIIAESSHPQQPPAPPITVPTTGDPTPIDLASQPGPDPNTWPPDLRKTYQSRLTVLLRQRYGIRRQQLSGGAFGDLLAHPTQPTLACIAALAAASAAVRDWMRGIEGPPDHRPDPNFIPSTKPSESK